MGIRFSKPQSPNPYALECSEPPQTMVETPRRRLFPPPSPAKHLTAAIMRRIASAKHRGAAVQEEAAELDRNFGLSKKFASRFEIGDEVGRGHFGYTCSAIAKKGEIKGRKVAVKVIPKSKMTTDVAIEDVRREIIILRALTGHQNVIQFYDAFEDSDSVYIVMELCQGGELLDRILQRGMFVEEYAKSIIVQILNAVAFFHLQGVVHRDIKPENFLFTSEDENSQLKAIDFGISDFVQPDQKLNDIVGSAYYVAPEVLKRSYSTEADVWSTGVIAYILLCGTRPFWDRTESGIFQAVMKATPSFSEIPWPSLSPESKDFVRCLLRKDPRRRITAAQALCHPWLRNHKTVMLPLDVQIFRSMKAYMRSSALRRAALRALSKTLTTDEVFYLKEQFALMFPDSSGGITLDSIKTGLVRNATDASRESRILDYLNPLKALGYRKMYFEEFRAAALNIHQLEIVENWEQRTLSAYEIFDKDGNRAIVIQELTSELGISPSVPIHVVLQEYIQNSDGKLTFPGFVKLLHRQPTCSSAKTP